MSLFGVLKKWILESVIDLDLISVSILKIRKKSIGATTVVKIAIVVNSNLKEAGELLRYTTSSYLLKNALKLI